MTPVVLIVTDDIVYGIVPPFLSVLRYSGFWQALVYAVRREWQGLELRVVEPRVEQFGLPDGCVASQWLFDLLWQSR